MSNSENPDQSSGVNFNNPGSVNIGGDIVGRDKNTTTTATTTTTTTNIEGGPVARIAVIGLITIAALAIILAFIVIAFFAFRDSPPATPIPSPTRSAAAVSAAATPLPTAPTLGIGSTQVSEKDGMVRVYVPAGEFLMGSSDSDTNAENDEKPQHEVYLDAFWIDKTEVTNVMYTLCVLAGACQQPDRTKSNTREHYYDGSRYKDYPMIYVSWNDAENYCAWAGRRLPTEAEWEKAARGTEGQVYPWGNAAPDPSLLNFNYQIGDTIEVGSYSNGASPFGALDMAGNVSEWVSDRYDDIYYANAPSANPSGPSSGSYRVRRGGSWASLIQGIRTTNRVWEYPDTRQSDVGFRCVRSP